MAMKDKDSPIVDTLTLRKDLYFVMSLLLADKEVAKIHNVVEWTQAFHEGEVRRLMLWITAAMRGLLDLLDAGNDEFSGERCGEYWDDFPDGKRTALKFRQACNSVIHAKEIWPYKVSRRESNVTVKQAYYIDRITIRGKHRRKTTRAQVDIIRFVRIADALINFFEENNDADR